MADKNIDEVSIGDKSRVISNSYFYEKVKRKELIDKCNICGQILHLTWDHVPPKFCFNDDSVKYNSLFNLNNVQVKKKTSQNGIKFRTICDDCNNRLLGADYDKEYKKLVDCLYDIYINPGEIGRYVLIQGLKVNKVVRAIIGHLLAARHDYCDSSFENELRAYFLDKNSLPPKNLKLLYYTYVFNTVLIMRDFVPSKLGNSDYSVPKGFMSCINSFPLAFILVSKCDDTCGLYDLFELCSENIEEEKDIKIDLLSYKFPNLKYVRDPFWPCNVSDDETGVSLILASDVAQKDSVLSNVRNLKKR